MHERECHELEYARTRFSCRPHTPVRDPVRLFLHTVRGVGEYIVGLCVGTCTTDFTPSVAFSNPPAASAASRGPTPQHSAIATPSPLSHPNRPTARHTGVQRATRMHCISAASHLHPLYPLPFARTSV